MFGVEVPKTVEDAIALLDEFIDTDSDTLKTVVLSEG